ncbi:aminotransferase class V-fold PLP-dependent enzyme [Algoriphagus namhaensis]
MSISRKDFLKIFGSSLALGSLPGTGFAKQTHSDVQIPTSGGEPTDEGFWQDLAKNAYSISSDFINLENGFFGIQPKPVLAAYQSYVEQVNREGALFARREYPKKAAEVKERLADFLQVSTEELLITRNATEAMNIVIQGYPWKQGDEVIVNQLDYYSMIETFQMLESRGILTVKTFEMPLLPDSPEEILQKYQAQVSKNTRAILLTQVSNITGLIVPVREISTWAKSQGIDTITDSAHALGHVPFDLREMDSDFVGMNLHKWMGNPIGAGVLFVKRERIHELQSFFGDKAPQNDSISRLGHMGTTPFAVQLSIPDSIAFHEKIGIDRIAARMHYLKKLWTEKVQKLQNIEVLTPTDSTLSCGMASFRVTGKSGKEIENRLLEEYGIFTVARVLGEKGCIRVTPGLYTQTEDVEKLAQALISLASQS